MKHKEAAAGVIIVDGSILCLKKGRGKHDYDAFKYEFPGGKIEKGETEEEAVVREIMEEIGMGVTVGEKLMTVEHTYPDMQLTMHVYLCNCENPEVTLTEHVEYKWLAKEELSELDWAEAEWKVVEVLESR